MIDGPGPIAGTTCPDRSITLGFARDGVGPGGELRWSVTATAHTNFVCRVHTGLEANIEQNGTVVRTLPGPVTFRDMFRPEETVVVAHLISSRPCDDARVSLVVRYNQWSYTRPARLALPAQPCRPGPVELTGIQFTGPDYKP
jgi:hypothetical protein